MRLILVALFLVLLPSLHVVSNATTQTGTATPIKHVIIVIYENHSVDNLFGVYPFGVPPIVNNVTCSVMRPVNLVEGPG